MATDGPTQQGFGPPKPGDVLHYEQLVGEWPTRFHLRVDPDGGGMLMANASEAAALSPVGVLMAHGILEGRGIEAISADVRRAYSDVSHERIIADLSLVQQIIDDLAAPGDNYPISNLGGTGETEWERQLSAPLRADMVQTDADTAREIMRRLWDVGVPHANILVDPRADTSQLRAIVEAAEDIGMIAGLRTVASWVSPELIGDAAMAGLDHLDVLYLSDEVAIHDALAGDGDHARALAAFEQCRELELCPVAQVAIVDDNAWVLDDVAESLADRDISNVVYYAIACLNDDTEADAAGALPARSLPQVAVIMEEAADDLFGRYLWAPPVRYNPARSLVEQVCAGPRTAGDIAVRIEADGSVLPPRGPATCAGNILTDAWARIWGNQCFTRYRERLKAPVHTCDCPELQIHAVDCPQDPKSWSYDEAGGAE